VLCFDATLIAEGDSAFPDQLEEVAALDLLSDVLLRRAGLRRVVESLEAVRDVLRLDRLPMVGQPCRKEYALRAEDNRVWSKEEIDQLFASDIASFERGVLRLVPGTAGRQSSFDALVSFAFNVGLGNLQRSTVRARANRGDWEGAAEALMMWTRGGGRVLPGLVRRRQAEREMFLA